jgi:Fur family transcriptional regulator, peroxide stress response regulator
MIVEPAFTFRCIINNRYLSVAILDRNLMTDPDVRFNQMIAALKERDFRLTPQRLELVRLIAASEGHPSASQLYAKIKRRFPTMSQGTVYKTLALLKEMDQVLEIDLRNDSHYDGNRPEPHPHLICIQCNKIIDGEVSLDPGSLPSLEQATGYQILRQQITLYGLCPDCKEAR